MKLKNSGFSLIELSVVILIIGILIAAITTGAGVLQRAKETKALAESRDSPIKYIIDDLLV